MGLILDGENIISDEGKRCKICGSEDVYESPFIDDNEILYLCEEHYKEFEKMCNIFYDDSLSYFNSSNFIACRLQGEDCSSSGENRGSCNS